MKYFIINFLLNSSEIYENPVQIVKSVAVTQQKCEFELLKCRKYLIVIFDNHHLQSRHITSRHMNKKTAQKWKLKKEKQQQSPTAINFKTHQLGESEAEIIIPKQYPQFNKNQQILVIECGKQKLLVQVSSSNSQTQRAQISVLKNLLDLQGIQCGSSGMFKGEIRILNQNKVIQHTLQIVQFMIKETYFSRRDQYKVMKALKQAPSHVYLRKTLYFDEIKIEVFSMMRNNQTIAKSGIIDKNTKIIFRSNCCKLTIGIEFSIQTFQLNEKKELYLQKMIEFLYVFLQRNNNFKSVHRLTLIFFGRCFYPQFKTLQAAYDYLLKENTSISDQQKFQINFSVALQKDYRGRIFQDVYRRIIWSSDMIHNFRQFFWQKISEFLFTLNWDTSDIENSIGKFITKSLSSKISDANLRQSFYPRNFDKSNLKIKPFIHKMKSKLSHSRDSNIFEAISLISEQYRHHYKFRSLFQTGNNILILSAGSAKYEVDEISYKMAKSYVYLTNITCSLINFSKKIENPLEAYIVCFNKKPIYTSQNKRKLEQISLNCIQREVYLSPMSEDMQIWEYFQLKNMIYPEEIIQVTPERSAQLKLEHHCLLSSHYQLRQSVVLQEKVDYHTKSKNVSFISVYNMNDLCLEIHQKIYGNMNINQLNYSTKKTQKYRLQELDIFQTDLDKIIISRKQWDFLQPPNEITNQFQSYHKFLERSKGLNKDDRNRQLEKVNRTIFKIYNQIQDEKERQNKFETMSNDEYNPFDHVSPKKRKVSESYSSESMEAYDSVQPEKGKINIFQATFRNKNHEYNAGQKNENKYKKWITHNKQRRKNLYFQSNVHYLMPQFNDQILKKFKAFIRKQYIQQLKDEEEKIVALFQMQKMWKDISFPLLTPIYTKYKQNYQCAQQHLDEGVVDESNDKKISILQDEICKLLMKNYQIQQSYSHYHNLTTKMSKGQVSCHLKMNGRNLTRSHIIDKRRQEKIIPFMLYRYLCYEDKDCRFCAKYVYFQDKNYYDFSKKKDLQTKTVKIVLGYSCCDDDKFDTLSGSFAKRQRDPFKQFVKQLNAKYRDINVELIGKNKPLQTPKKKKFTINLTKKESRALYHHQEIEVEINLEYNYSSLFQILVSWNLCSSVIVKQFVDNIEALAYKWGLKQFLVTAGNIFNTIWSITTIGEIIFQHRISLQLLQNNILQGGEWLWDSNDYYLHNSGISYIQFKKEKKLILWRDNNNQKRNRDRKKDDSSKEYTKFFMKSATFDFIGGIIEKVIEDAQTSAKIQPK